MALDVRRAVSSDWHSIASLDPSVETDPRRKDRLHRAVAARELWVVEVSEQVLGYGLLSASFFGQPFIELVYIRPDQRNRGLGALLVRHLEAVSPEGKLFTSTNQSNTHMRHVLDRLGFVESGIVENLDPGDPEIIYFKRLTHAKAGDPRQ